MADDSVPAAGDGWKPQTIANLIAAHWFAEATKADDAGDLLCELSGADCADNDELVAVLTHLLPFSAALTLFALENHLSRLRARPRSQERPGDLAAWQIRGARKGLNLSQRDLAAAAGVSVSAIRRIEAKQHVQLATILAIRSFLEGQGVEFLVCGLKPPPNGPPLSCRRSALLSRPFFAGRLP